MIDINTAGRDLQDEILKLIRTSQDSVVDALQAWTATVESVTPSFPKVNLPNADQMPSRRRWSTARTTSPSNCWPHSASSRTTSFRSPRR